MSGMPLAFGVFVALSVLLGFIGLWRMTGAEDAVDARLRQYAGNAPVAEVIAGGARPRLPGMNRAMSRLSLTGALADRLTRADLALTVAEFALIVFLLAAALALVGWWRGGVLLGAVMGIVGVFLPQLYLNMRASKRRQAFTNQLPDVLTLLVGALRAGYGTTQAISTLVERMDKPASIEFGRVVRAVSLGVPVNRALNDMADRAGGDDLYLMVTAMNVQAELGGNLAQILETITETVRERIRIKREIGVLTAQQRMTGYLLSAMPIVFGLLVSLLSPDYLGPLFAPGLMRIVVIVAVLMQLVGFLVIRKIVDIEV